MSHRSELAGPGKAEKVRMSPPIPVSEYVDTHGGMLDGKRFVAMRDAGGEEEMVDRQGIRRSTAAGGWRKRWNHWGGRGCVTTKVWFTNTDMPYVRCEEEGDYVKRLGSLIEQMDRSERTEAVHRDFCCLGTPHKGLWFFDNFDYWRRDLDFERRLRQRAQCPVFAGCHNTEIFAVPTSCRLMFYVSVPAWWRAIEVSVLLVVPSPRVFAFYSNRVFDGSPREVETIWRIAKSEWVVMAVLSFLAACRDGVFLGTNKDTRLGNSGILVPLPRPFIQLIEEYGFFHVVESSGFDPALAYLAYCRSCEVDWGKCGLRQPYYRYDWSIGRVIPLLAVSVSSKKRAHNRKFVQLNETLPEVPLAFLSSEGCSLEDAKAEVVEFFGPVKEVVADVEVPVPEEAVDPYEANDGLDWGLEDLVAEASTSKGPAVKAALDSLNGRLFVCGMPPVTDGLGIIRLASSGMDDMMAAQGHQKALDDVRAVAVVEQKRLEEELTKSRGRVSHLETFLRAEKEEVKRLVALGLSQKESVTGARVTALEKELEEERTSCGMAQAATDCAQLESDKWQEEAEEAQEALKVARGDLEVLTAKVTAAEAGKGRLEALLETEKAESKAAQFEQEECELREIALKQELLASERQEVSTRNLVTAAKRQASEAEACLDRVKGVVGEVTAMMRSAPDKIDDMLNAQLAVFARRVRCATADSIGDVETKLLEVTGGEPDSSSSSSPNGS